MRSGITRQALKRHRYTLVGTAITQVVAAMIIQGMTTAQTSVNSSLTVAQRLARPDVLEFIDAAEVFLGDAIILAVVIIGVTMSLAMTRQLEDIALLRSIGATPGQIRRSAIFQSLALVLPSSVIGCAIAIPATSLWLSALRASAVIPVDVSTHFSPAGLPVSLLVLTSASITGASIAARRTAKLKPAAAIVEVVSGRTNISAARIRTGKALLLVGFALSTILSTVAPTQLGDTTVFVMLAECIGVGLAGPWIFRRTITALRRVAPSDFARLAIDDLATMKRTLSGVLIPLVLALAFAFVNVAAHTTALHQTGIIDSVSDRWLDYSGTAQIAVFAIIAAVNCLVTAVAGRSRDYAAMRLAGGSRRDIITIALAQSVILTVIALVVSAVIATATLVPLLHATINTWVPYVPPETATLAILSTLTLVAGAMTVPAVIVTHRPAIRVNMASR